MGTDQLFMRCALAFALGLTLLAQAHAADRFRKLTDAEIRARLASMEITDGIHWAEQYMRDGTYKAFDMGKPSKGKWYARGGELCLDDGKAEPDCKEVWMSGTKVDFRQPGSSMPGINEGVLQKQQKRG